MGKKTHTLATDFIHLASQYWMSVHLFHLVPKCGTVPQSGQVSKPLSQYNPSFLSDDTIVSINLTSRGASAPSQRRMFLEMLTVHVWQKMGIRMGLMLT